MTAFVSPLYTFRSLLVKLAGVIFLVEKEKKQHHT